MKRLLIGLFCFLGLSMFVFYTMEGSTIHAKKMERKLSRKTLIEDIRELSNIFETAHPDPYINGGGKIAYYRRLQNLIRGIPSEGMTKEDFYYYLLPFIAKLGDGHTKIFHKEFSPKAEKEENPGGIPLYFQPIEERLYVSAVVHEEDLRLIGSLLVSVEGVPFTKLAERLDNLKGNDNQYHLLKMLGGFGFLYHQKDLKLLVPEWDIAHPIKVVLQLPSGREKEIVFSPAKGVKYPLKRLVVDKLSLDSKGSLSYQFLKKDKNIAYLRIDDMVSYREAHELWQSIGLKDFDNLARELYKLYNPGKVPKDMNEVISKIPSATELFMKLFTEMKQANTEYLIVDLRKCPGGQDSIIWQFLYFLVDFEKAMPIINNRSHILKLSEFLNKSTTRGINLKRISYYDQVPLTINDYDFSGDLSFIKKRNNAVFQKPAVDAFNQFPSFQKAYRQDKYGGCYLPKKMIVLCSSNTRSSGFDLMQNLKRLGAVCVGIPPGQSGNHFGNVSQFQLTYSRIKGFVATRFFIGFPEKPRMRLLHKPEFELTYKTLASYNFDKNAILLFALKLIEQKKI